MAIDCTNKPFQNGATRFLVDTSKDFFEQLCVTSLSVVFTEVNSDGTASLVVQ